MRKFGAHAMVQTVPALYTAPTAAVVSQVVIASGMAGSAGHVTRSHVPGYWLTGWVALDNRDEVAGDTGHTHSPVAEHDTEAAGELRE
jgi:hypothetical protein